MNYTGGVGLYTQIDLPFSLSRRGASFPHDPEISGQPYLTDLTTYFSRTHICLHASISLTVQKHSRSRTLTAPTRSAAPVAAAPTDSRSFGTPRAAVIASVSDSFDDSDANLWISCIPCHLAKASEENSARNKRRS